MANRIAERNKANIQAVVLTSAVGLTGKRIDMSNADEVVFVCGMGTAAGGIQPAFQVIQAANDTATGGNITGALVTLGSSAATRVDKARQCLITVSSATTDSETLVINGTSFITSTAAVASSLQFGSTAGTTAAGGIDAIVRSLSSLINANVSGVVATTASTVAVRISVKDTADTSITVVSTGANLTPAYESQQGMISVMAKDLDSTSKYVGISVGTVATSVQVSCAQIRSGLRYSPNSTGFGPYTVTT